MRKSFQILLIVFTALTLFFPVVSALTVSPTVTLQEMEGTVEIIQAGQSRAAAIGDMINPEDLIKTGEDGKTRIVVGETGEVKLNKESSWSYQKYSVEDGKHQFTANLALGRLRANVKKLPKGSNFEIKTPTSVAAVRGTSFGLYVYVFDQQVFTQLDVFESAVELSTLKGDQSIVVQEGYSSTVNPVGEMTPPQNIEGFSEKKSTDEKSDEKKNNTNNNNPPPGGNPPGAPPPGSKVGDLGAKADSSNTSSTDGIVKNEMNYSAALPIMPPPPTDQMNTAQIEEYKGQTEDYMQQMEQSMANMETDMGDSDVFNDYQSAMMGDMLMPETDLSGTNPDMAAAMPPPEMPEPELPMPEFNEPYMEPNYEPQEPLQNLVDGHTVPGGSSSGG